MSKSIPISIAQLKSAFGTFQFVKLSGDIGVQTTASVTIPDLVFSVKANQTYDFRFNLIHSANVGGQGVKVQINVPNYKTYSARIELPNSYTTTQIQYVTASGGSLVSTSMPGPNQVTLGLIEGMIVPAEDGQIQIAFASKNLQSGSNFTALLAGSNGMLIKFA